MTEENQRRLYNHFIATKQKDKAEAFLVKYPHFAQPVEETKSKGKK